MVAAGVMGRQSERVRIADAELQQAILQADPIS
jgi:hypothetical protein